MHLAKSLLNWTWTQWNQSLMESHWEQHIRPKVHNPAVVEGDHHLEQEIHVTSGPCTYTNACLLIGLKTSNPNVEHSIVLAEGTRKTDLKAHLAEHASVKKAGLSYGFSRILWFIKEPLYLCSMPRGETKDLLLFKMSLPWMGATKIWVIRDMTIPCLCYRSISGWPGMTNQMQQSIKSCMCCLQHEGDLSKYAPIPDCGHCFDGPLACRLY